MNKVKIDYVKKPTKVFQYHSNLTILYKKFIFKILNYYLKQLF